MTGEDIKKLLEDKGVWRRGHFILPHTRLHARDFVDGQALVDDSSLRTEIAQELAKRLIDQGVPVDGVAGVGEAGRMLAQALRDELAHRLGVRISPVLLPHGEASMPLEGASIVVVDVVTLGDAEIRQVVTAVQELGGRITAVTTVLDWCGVAATVPSGALLVALHTEAPRTYQRNDPCPMCLGDERVEMIGDEGGSHGPRFGGDPPEYTW